MKGNLLLLFWICLFSHSTKGQSNLNITITNIRNTKGNIGIALFNDADKFLKKHGGFTGKFVEIKKKGPVNVSIEDLPDGIYAVSVFHDENGNGEMDQNLLGIPTEDYGFSNNAKSPIGPPSYEDAAIEVKGGEVNISISLR